MRATCIHGIAWFRECDKCAWGGHDFRRYVEPDPEFVDAVVELIRLMEENKSKEPYYIQLENK